MVPPYYPPLVGDGTAVLSSTSGGWYQRTILRYWGMWGMVPPYYPPLVGNGTAVLSSASGEWYRRTILR
ncbi:hypothetical protein AGABI1DRAFT_135197 [Agaricus bisporus var. burnettii JB137-S8]|uniref:Uncharacterized protein n=1 Tax=Agaricus bisporus var. burnettii (strain JB137-S8 / ATCC MYA-4627 / FGSC 10392) TaxID=597362 RepID=K5VG22_AGABU|nr:uncharacterized protein AGABI1DRAFT_135197 [Agaricus bisporus var. burnettii JB137-S8]EKM73264.1 hypothetical protein AGABI1DRAFT_135197 [Agaricus bisporus var. burnettii JB137-S8]